MGQPVHIKILFNRPCMCTLLTPVYIQGRKECTPHCLTPVFIQGKGVYPTLFDPCSIQEEIKNSVVVWHPQSYAYAGSFSSPDPSLLVGPQAIGASRSPSMSTGIDLPTGHPQSYVHAGSLSSPDPSLVVGPQAIGVSRSPSTSTGVDLPMWHPQTHTYAGSLSTPAPSLSQLSTLRLVNPNPDLLHQTVTRKTTQRASPVLSPSKQTRSPAPKQRRRFQTGTEQRQSTAVAEVLSHSLPSSSTANSQRDLIRSKTLSAFEISREEKLVLKELQEELNTYMIIISIYNNIMIAHGK